MRSVVARGLMTTIVAARTYRRRHLPAVQQRPSRFLTCFRPADMFHGRRATILARRARIKHRTLQQRQREHLHQPHHAAIRSEVSL